MHIELDSNHMSFTIPSNAISFNSICIRLPYAKKRLIVNRACDPMNRMISFIGRHTRDTDRNNLNQVMCTQLIDRLIKIISR